jgi:hypothetical protein
MKLLDHKRGHLGRLWIIRKHPNSSYPYLFQRFPTEKTLGAPFATGVNSGEPKFGEVNGLNNLRIARETNAVAPWQERDDATHGYLQLTPNSRSAYRRSLTKHVIEITFCI